MKKRILWMIISVNMFLPVFAIDADSLVQAGNRYYVSNDYQKAADTYQLVIDSGFVAVPDLPLLLLKYVSENGS